MFEISDSRYRQMAQMPRYVSQHYELVNGLERKLFSTSETLRYRNFFDGPTMENLSNRLEHHKMLLKNLKIERLTAPPRLQEGMSKYEDLFESSTENASACTM